MQNKPHRPALGTAQHLTTLPQTVIVCPHSRQTPTHHCRFVAHFFGSVRSSMLLLSEMFLGGKENHHNIVSSWCLTSSAGDQ